MAKKKDIQLPPDVTDVILESISDGVFTVDHQWHITSFNHAAEEITGIPRKEAIGRRCCEVFRANMCETDCALKRTMREGKPFVDSSTYIVNSEQERIPVIVSTARLVDGSGAIIGGVETFRDMSLVETLRRELDAQSQVGGMVSRSPKMQKIFSMLPQIANSDAAVLIQGETGTGKEVMARAIHDASPRAKKPFVAVNCGALPDTLLESELFGHKKGAFTGAIRDKKGRFALAAGGTLFLDEIAGISPAFQVRLLRVLQDGTYTPLGADREENADVRVLAAGNQDVSEMVARGEFRQDLFYRINILKIDLPPLRERREDIPLLVDQTIRRLNASRGRQVTGIAPEALALLQQHEFPGNIRELINIIEHAFVMCAHGGIGLHCLPESLQPPHKVIPAGNFQSTVSTAEAQTIWAALERNNFNRLAAANELGIHKSTLFRKIKKLGLELPELDGRSKAS